MISGAGLCWQHVGGVGSTTTTTTTLIETREHLAMANSERLHCHVLKKDDHILKKILEFARQRNKGTPKKIWIRHVDEEGMMVGVSMEGAHCRSIWSVCINQIATSF